MNEKYVAIKYEKVYITDDLYVFKPVGLIRGNYDKGVNVFETNYGDLCISITSSDYGELNYFGFPIEIKELKEQSEDLDEFYLLNKYFVEKSEQFCIGYYNVDVLNDLAANKNITSFDVEVLKQNGLISSNDKVKILGRGELTVKIDVTAHAISNSARKAIEDKGGIVTLLGSKTNEE